MITETELLLQDDGTPEFMYHNRTWLLRFLWAKGMAAKDIHKDMLPVYGEHCLSRQAFHNWVQRFSEGRTNIEDEHRVGRPVEIATSAKNFTPRSFHGRVKRRDKCLNLYGDYVEK
jgi:hypothetical protein